MGLILLLTKRADRAKQQRKEFGQKIRRITNTGHISMEGKIILGQRNGRATKRTWLNLIFLQLLLERSTSTQRRKRNRNNVYYSIMYSVRSSLIICNLISLHKCNMNLRWIFLNVFKLSHGMSFYLNFWNHKKVPESWRVAKTSMNPLILLTIQNSLLTYSHFCREEWMQWQALEDSSSRWLIIVMICFKYSTTV